MKVMFKYGIGAFAGTIDSAVYRMSDSRICSYMRKWVYPRLTPNNAVFGKIGKNLKNLWLECATLYKSDFKTYMQRWGSENVITEGWDVCKCSYAFFILMMWNWKKSDPEHVDLSTITLSDIMLAEAPVLTIPAAIEATLLPTIANYSDLTHPMGE